MKETAVNFESMPELLVVVGHSGLAVPVEIPLDSLSEHFTTLLGSVDWYTDCLYDFRDLLDNRQLVFPYCSLILEANRHPGHIEESVPLRDVYGRAVYRRQRQPGQKLRRKLAVKYLQSFHSEIEKNIMAGAELMLDGHSTVSARGMADHQVELMNYQHSAFDEQAITFCPQELVEEYAAELRKNLPEILVTVNASTYHQVYGHICSAHSVNSLRREGNRVPAIIQETNERLYLNQDRSPDVQALNRLRRAFAVSLRTAWSRTCGRK